MLQLPNGCSCSGTPGDPKKGTADELSVSPADWKTVKASTKKTWYIYYRFYDPLAREQFPEGKLVQIKGMNKYKTLKERQLATRVLIKEELNSLKVQGFNPITRISLAEEVIDYEINPNTPFPEALHQAYIKLGKAKPTMADIKSTVGGMTLAIKQLRFDQLEISNVRRRHILMCLDRCQSVVKGWSAKRRNKYRCYLLILFKKLVLLEATEINPISDIPIEKTVKKFREVLDDETLRFKIDRHLLANHYSFWRFMHIFFHSGSRETEIMLVKGQDVNLEKQEVKYTVLKGNNPTEVRRAIKDSVLHLWREAVENCRPDQYVFAKGLVPGDVAINPNQIGRRWRTHVKRNKVLQALNNGVAITADFYSLKHLNTDQTAALLDLEDAAKHNSHTSTVITMKNYAFGEKERQQERLRKVNNKFAG